MKRIDVTITALSPLAIGQRKPGGSVSEALDHIPGTVIRGAVAGKVLNHAESEPTPGDDFHRLFLDETATIFSNAYPAIAKRQKNELGDYFVSESDIGILPASALSTKTDSGFRPDHQGVFDSLIDSYCADSQGYFYAPNTVQGELVDSFSGFYSQVNGHYYRHSVTNRLLTRVGINRKRATAQDEILYSIEVLNESHGKTETATGKEAVPTVYKSYLLVRDHDENLAKQFHAFLQARCHHLRIGGSASRGLGKIQMELSDLIEVKNTVNLLKERVNAFNELLKQRWGLWSLLGGAGTAEIDHLTFFTLNLQSDAILAENWRRTTVVSPAILSPLLGLNEADISLQAASTSHAYRSGWNAAWGLPKDTELVTERGGVLLFSIPTAKASDCYEALANLEQNGLGERCSEGYGQVKVCDDFHQIIREQPV